MSNLVGSRMVAAADVARLRAPCPRCAGPLTAEPVRIVQASDRGLRDSLLAGRLNVVECPACGASVRVVSPVLFHDPEASTALVFLPDSLASSHEEQQRTIGSLTSAALQGLSEDTPRGHLLQPTIFLSEESFHEAVLVASGVPKESIVAAREMAALIERLAEIEDASALAEALRNSPHGADPTLHNICFDLAERADASGDTSRAERLRTLSDRLRSHIAQPPIDLDALLEALEAARVEDRLDLIVQQIRPALDYTFFASLTERMASLSETNGNPAKVDLLALRGALLASLDVVEAFERQWADSAKIWIERLVAADDTLRRALVRMMAFSGLLDSMFFTIVGGLRSAVGNEGERAARLESVQSLAQDALDFALKRMRDDQVTAHSAPDPVGTPS